MTAKVAATKPTSSKFMFTDTELSIIKNFAFFNPNMLFNNKVISVMNDAKSVIGRYEVDTPYEFEDFAIYEVPEFLTLLGNFTSPEIEVKDKYVEVYETSGPSEKSKLKYFTTMKDLIKIAPDPSKKFNELDIPLEFTFTSDKFAILNKMANILKTEYVFFESDGKKVRITVADELESSANSYEITIDENIEANKLEKPVKIKLAEFKLIAGTYEVKISEKISKWSNANGVDYFIGVSI